EFCQLLPLDAPFAGAQYDQSQWPAMRQAIATRIAQRPRDEWATLFEPTDACVAPVLSFIEAPAHPHNKARQTHQTQDGLTRPAPAPRFSRTTPTASATIGRDVDATLAAFGFSGDDIDRLANDGT